MRNFFLSRRCVTPVFAELSIFRYYDPQLLYKSLIRQPSFIRWHFRCAFLHYSIDGAFDFSQLFASAFFGFSLAGDATIRRGYGLASFAALRRLDYHHLASFEKPRIFPYAMLFFCRFCLRIRYLYTLFRAHDFWGNTGCSSPAGSLRHLPLHFCFYAAIELDGRLF